jgi:hypothetical protein
VLIVLLSGLSVACPPTSTVIVLTLSTSSGEAMHATQRVDSRRQQLFIALLFLVLLRRRDTCCSVDTLLARAAIYIIRFIVTLCPAVQRWTRTSHPAFGEQFHEVIRLLRTDYHLLSPNLHRSSFRLLSILISLAAHHKPGRPSLSAMTRWALRLEAIPSNYLFDLCLVVRLSNGHATPNRISSPAYIVSAKKMQGMLSSV